MISNKEMLVPLRPSLVKLDKLEKEGEKLKIYF